MDANFSQMDFADQVKRMQNENPLLPLHGIVHNLLKREIITCRLIPGQDLREADLAGKFGVSRTTIRNALSTLEHEGLLVQAGRSMRVASVTRAQYTQLHEFRRYMDPIAASLAAARYSQKDLEQMERFLENSRLEDPEAFLEADSGFHCAIYEAAKNTYLLQAYLQIDPARRRMNYFSVISISKDNLWEFSQSKRERMRADHQKIYEAIKNADEQSAASLARKHVGLLLFDFDSYEKRFSPERRT